MQSIIEELQELQLIILSKQKSILSEVLSLEQLLNNLLPTHIIRQKNQNKNVVKKQQPKEFNIEKINNKIEQMLDQTEEIDITEPKAMNYKSLKQKAIKNSTKQQIDPFQIVKKPSVPTVNRSSDASKISTIPKYIPPRNKNQVTGKVTQNKIMTQQKTFKPEIISSKTIKNSNSAENPRKNNKCEENIKEKQKDMQYLDNDKNAVSEYKNLRSKEQIGNLHKFKKSIDEIVQQVATKKQDKTKQNLKPLLQKYQKQEMGHKGLEEKKRCQFLNKFVNFSISKNSSIPDITSSTIKRHWKQYPYIFGFNDLLQDLQAKVNVLLENQENDLRADPKQSYRIQVMKQVIEKQLSQIIESTRISVPQKIDLNFKSKIQQDKVQQVDSIAGSKNINFSKLYEKLNTLLYEIQQEQNLSSEKISQVRMILEIVRFRGRQCPTVVLTDQFQEWTQFYSEYK